MTLIRTPTPWVGPDPSHKGGARHWPFPPTVGDSHVVTIVGEEYHTGRHTIFLVILNFHRRLLLNQTSLQSARNLTASFPSCWSKKKQVSWCMGKITVLNTETIFLPTALQQEKETTELKGQLQSVIGDLHVTHIKSSISSVSEGGKHLRKSIPREVSVTSLYILFNVAITYNIDS